MLKAKHRPKENTLENVAPNAQGGFHELEKATHRKSWNLQNLCFTAIFLLKFCKNAFFYKKNHRAGENILEFLAPNAHRRFWWKKIVPIPWQERTRLRNLHSHRGGLAKREVALKEKWGSIPSHRNWRTRGLDTKKSCNATLGRSKLYSQRRLGESAHSEILNTSWARTRLRKTIHFSAIFWHFLEIQDFRSLFATPLAFRECRFCGFLKTSNFYITLAMIPWKTDTLALRVLKKWEFASPPLAGSKKKS